MIAFLAYLLITIGLAALIARKWDQHQSESDYGYVDNEDRAFAVFISTIVAAFWPITLPLALIGGSVWFLAFKKKSKK